MVLCPQCEAEIDLVDDLEEGETVDCPECDAKLEVVNANPLELDVIPTMESEEDEEEQSW
jgi:alpha-aminoadipate/glutamate carrier protein LysW